jgi:hypothetical protein
MNLLKKNPSPVSEYKDFILMREKYVEEIFEIDIFSRFKTTENA